MSDKIQTSTLGDQKPLVLDLQKIKESIAVLMELPPHPVKMNCSREAIDLIKNASKSASSNKELCLKVSNAWSSFGLPYHEVSFLGEGQIEIIYSDGSNKIINLKS